MQHRLLKVNGDHAPAGGGQGGGAGWAAHLVFHHAVVLRVAHGVGVDGGAMAVVVAGGQLGHQIVAVEEVVAEHEGSGGTGEEVGGDEEGLGEAIGAGLDGVMNGHAPAAAITEEPLEEGLIVWGGDDEHLPDPRQHEGAEGVIDHGLVVGGQELFAHRLGDRVQTGAAAAGQDQPLAAHGRFLLLRRQRGA